MEDIPHSDHSVLHSRRGQPDLEGPLAQSGKEQSEEKERNLSGQEVHLPLCTDLDE